MDIYQDSHINQKGYDNNHYHLGDGEYGQPIAQNKLFEKIIKLLKKQLPGHLYLVSGLSENLNKYIKIVNEKNQSYVYMNLYKYRGTFPPQWRVKIIPYESGREFFENAFKSIIKSIPDTLYQGNKKS